MTCGVLGVGRRHGSAVVLLLALALLAAACGKPSLLPEGSGPDQAVSATLTGESTTPDPRTTVATSLASNELFADPEGSYEMVVSKEWTTAHGSIGEGIELWGVAPAVDGFTPNVNAVSLPLLIQLSIKEYLDISIETATQYMPDFQLVRQETIAGRDNNQLAVMEYTGTVDGMELHFLGVFGLGGDEVIIVTLGAPPERYDTVAQEIEPYLLSLVPK